MITCTDPTWCSYSRCYSDAERNESSTDHQAFIFTAYIFQWTHRLITWKHNCGLLTGYQYSAGFASVIRHGTDTMAQTACYFRNTCWCWNTKFWTHSCIESLEYHRHIFSYYVLLLSKQLNIHQLLNTVMTPKISKYLCVAFPPALSLFEWVVIRHMSMLSMPALCLQCSCIGYLHKTSMVVEEMHNVLPISLSDSTSL